MSAKRARAVVIGRVQGVSYRASTEAEARRLGVTGWVRNLGDGSVEIVVEGDEAAVDELLAWARRGPTYAGVERVDVEWEAWTGAFAAFEVRR